MITTENIFIRAAERYFFRKGESVNIESKAYELKDEMADLCEKILALRDVGALPKGKE